MAVPLLKITEKAMQDAHDVGIYGDVQKRLSRMARRAARISSIVGNRRYHEFILKVEGDTVSGVARFTP